METIFSNGNGNSRRSGTRRSVYQATPFGTPPLGRQADPLRGSYVSSQHSSSCSGSSSWVLWRDEPSSLYRDPRGRRGRLCSAVLAVAVFLVVLTVLAIAGLAVYMGALRIDTNKLELVFDGSVCVTSGDHFIPSLGNNSSIVFKEMALKYQNMIDTVYQRSQLRPAYKKCVIEKFENGSLIVFFRLYLDRRKIPRNFQNVEETARDILVNELIAPRTVAFRNIHIDASSIFIKRSLDDAVISPIEGIPRKKPPGNGTLQIHNGVMRKTTTEDTSTMNITQESPTITKQENSEIKKPDTEDLRNTTQETEGEAIPIVEGSVSITKIKGTTMETPSEKPSTLKEGSNVPSSNRDKTNADSKRENDTLSKPSGNSVPENIQNEADRDIKQNSKLLLTSTVRTGSISEINLPEEKVYMKPDTGAKMPTVSTEDTKYSTENDEKDPIRLKTQSPYMPNKKQPIKNDENVHLGQETITKFSAVDGIRKDITHTKQYNQEHNFESLDGVVNDLDGKISQNANGSLIKKIGEEYVLSIGSAEDFTTNPLTNNDRYHTQPTPGLNSNFWNTGSRSTAIPSTEPVGLNTPGTRYNYTGTELTNENFKGSFIHTVKPPHIQTDEPWRPILPYYTKQSPKPDDDDTGTGVAEVVVVPPSALENQKTNGDQNNGNKYSSRLGQPASNHKLQETLSGGYGSFSLFSDVQESQLSDTISRVSLHVVGTGTGTGTGGFSGENLETSILHTTSGGGIIIRKQHQPATFLSPHTIPLTYTTPEPPSARQSIDNPFIVPELPILHQFHDVDALLKASPSKNAHYNMTPIHHKSESFEGDFAVNRKWMSNSSSDGNTDPRNPNAGTGSISSANQQWAELHDVTPPTAKPQHSSHTEAFLTRYHQHPAWGDMANKARLGNTNIPFKDIGIPSTVMSIETSLSNVQLNKSTRVQFATLNPLFDSVKNTPFSIVTLIPVRSNSGVGRPLRPRPKIPSHTYLQIKNQNEPTNVVLSSEYNSRTKAGDPGQSSPTPIGSDAVSGVQAEISHDKHNNSAGFTTKSDGAMISFNHSSNEAPKQEVQSMTLDYKSQSSDINYSTELILNLRKTYSLPQETSTLSPFSTGTLSEISSTMGTVPASIKVTHTQSPIKAVPMLSTARQATISSTDQSISGKLTISTQQSTAQELITSPSKKEITLETSGTTSPTTTTNSPSMKTAPLSTAPTTKTMKPLPPSSLLPATKSIQTTTEATLSPKLSSLTPEFKLNDSASANLASNINHLNQTNKTATDKMKNATHLVESMVRISPVSALKQKPSTVEVLKNTTEITKSNNTNIKETNRNNTVPVSSLDQKTLTTSTVSHFTQISTVTFSEHSYPSAHPSPQPTIIHTTPSMFIPVIVIQDPPHEYWHNNSHTQTGKVISTVPMLEVPPNSNNVHNGTGGHTEDITRNTTAITHAPKTQENPSLRTSELRDNKNLTGNKQGQNMSVIPKLQSDNNSSNGKPESVTENKNIAPQPHVVAQAVIFNTDTVTTTSIEVSFGENTGKVSTDPLRTSQSPNRTKYGDDNHTSTVELPVTFPSALMEKASTHKLKETRRKPKMKQIFTDPPLFENSRREEHMMGSAGNSKIEDRTDIDFLMPKVADVIDTTTSLNTFNSEEKETKNIAVTVTEYESENYTYRIHSDVPRTVAIKLNSMTEGPVTQNYGSDQVSSTEEEISLAQSNVTTYLTKERPPQEKELSFNSTVYIIEQDPVLQRTTEEIILTTDEIFPAFSNVSVPKDEVLSTKELLMNTSDDTLETFTNFTVTKVKASSSIQDKRQPENSEMSADDIMHWMNATRNHSIMSQEAVNTLSKYANVHSAISSNNVSKDSQNKVYNDEDKIINDSTENYAGEKITNFIDTEEAKLSTKAIFLHASNNHAGIPILTKIYNKAPQQLGEKETSIEEGSPDLANSTACPSNLSLRCGDGDCISSLSRCNQLVDCSDGIDEQGCSCADYLKAQFLTRKLCDGVVDCWDFSDENNCEWCSPGQFVCPNSQVCVDQHQLCDGARDCPYGDDEKQCVTVAQNESTAGGFPYNSEGYLMVRKQGRWGKLCLQNFDNVVARSQSVWEVADLGRAVCKAMTYSDFETVNRTVDTPSSSRADSSHYFELTYSSDAYNNSQPRSSLSFQETQCSQKEVVHVSCRDLRCGIRPQAINQWARIVGGGNAAPGSWPWQAALYKEGEFQCGATLIADRWLVSAGHCFYHALDDYWVARLGALRRGSSFPSPYEQLRPVSHIILHPGYVDAGFLNDISLLRLRDPVQFTDFVRPVCLPPAPIHDGRLCTVVGWGQLFEVGRIFPDTLQEVQLPIISTAECRKRTLFLPLYRVTDNMFCAGFDRGGRDACLGDSGGPLMCQEKDGHWSLYGVTSNGYGCARANRPGVYTKVSNYVPWLQATMMQQVSSLRDSKTQCKGHRCPLGECLPPTRVCNGFMECSDGSDEKGCW